MQHLFEKITQFVDFLQNFKIFLTKVTKYESPLKTMSILVSATKDDRKETYTIKIKDWG
jgi:hypothetical protein